jgi:hypothetical protein
MPQLNAASTDSHRFQEQSTSPSTPASGFVSLYAHENGNMRSIDDAGNIRICAGFYLHTASTTDGSATAVDVIATETDKTYTLLTTVAARRTGGSAGSAGDSAGYELFGAFKNVGGTLSQVGTTTIVAKEDQAAWAADFAVSGTDIQVSVTGAADNDVSWVIHTRETIA